MSSVAKFAIGAKLLNNPNLIEYQPNSVEYTYVASAVSIALALLNQEQSKRTLVDIASHFDRQRLDSATFQADPAAATKWVDWFLENLRSQFPRVIVDDEIIDLDNLGLHPRRHWDGALEDFPFKRQGIHLNASVGEKSQFS